MNLIEKYINAIRDKDYLELANLFDVNGSITDYGPLKSPYLAYGKEAIEMLYRNLFYYGSFKVLEIIDINGSRVTFVASYDGYRRVVRAAIDASEDFTKLRRVIIRPA